MATIEVKLKPFQVPSFVIAEQPPGKKQDGFRVPESHHLSSIDTDTLWQMCDDFRKGVFKRAGKKMPKTVKKR